MKELMKDLRNRFLILATILGVAFCVFLKQETNRVNNVTEAYLTQMAQKTWIMGCVSGRGGDIAYCNELVKSMDFTFIKEGLNESSD